MSHDNIRNNNYKILLTKNDIRLVRGTDISRFGTRLCRNSENFDIKYPMYKKNSHYKLSDIDTTDSGLIKFWSSMTSLWVFSPIRDFFTVLLR